MTFKNRPGGKIDLGGAVFIAALVAAAYYIFGRWQNPLGVAPPAPEGAGAVTAPGNVTGVSPLDSRPQDAMAAAELLANGRPNDALVWVAGSGDEGGYLASSGELAGRMLLLAQGDPTALESPRAPRPALPVQSDPFPAHAFVKAIDARSGPSDPYRWQEELAFRTAMLAEA